MGERFRTVGVLAALALAACDSHVGSEQPADKQASASQQAVEFQNVGWTVYNKEFALITYKGAESLRIKQGPGDGVAVLDGVQCENCVIEVDIAAIPSFTGVVFRFEDADRYDAIYFRPQNSRHQSTQKRDHTVQYISHPKHTWNYLREKFPGVYEGPVDIAPKEWFHARIVVSGSRAEVYVDNAKKPCLVVEDLKRSGSGGVGVWSGNGSAGTFSGFVVRAEQEAS